MQKFITILFAGTVLLSASCQKQFSPLNEQKQKTVDPAKIFKTPSSPEEKLLVENLGKVTQVFKELYKDRSNIKLVNAAIFSKLYSAESILLKDLIYPASNPLDSSAKFKTFCRKWNISLEAFSKQFWFEANKKDDPQFKQFLAGLNTANRITSKTGSSEPDQASIYFPYSDEFLPPDVGTYEPIASIVTATADADEGWGELPYFVNGVFQYYVQVLVNDDYAFSNPTLIIGVNGLEFIDNILDPQDPPPPPPPPGISRVYVGEGLCKKQYDRLISFTGNGGGSEIKYCHMTAYLQPVNGHVTTFQDIASVNFSRKDIRNKNWLRVYIVWDDDWPQTDFEQFFAIYEEDNTHSVTFTGSVGTTLAVDSGSTITASIGFTITRQSQDDIIRQLKISRNSYFAGAYQDQAWGFRSDYTFIPPPIPHGWPIYDATSGAGADVGWTWPYNTM